MNNKNDVLFDLTNPAIEFDVAGRKFEVKQANLGMLVLFRKYMTTLDAGDSTQDILLAVKAIYLVLKDKYSDVTEEWLLENLPANIETLEVLVKLGFMTPQKAELATTMLETETRKITG